MSINRTPKTWGSEAATSADMNAEVKALWDGLQDAYDSYTPSWTSTGTAPTLGNGVRSGRYMQVGKKLHFRIALQFGSTTTNGTGFYKFSLPAASTWSDSTAVGQGTYYDDSTGETWGFVAYLDDSGTTVRLSLKPTEKVGASYPVTPNTSDRITITGTVELS